MRRQAGKVIGDARRMYGAVRWVTEVSLINGPAVHDGISCNKCGGLAEWSKAPALKAGMERKFHHGFESFMPSTNTTLGDMPELVKGPHWK